MFLYKFKTLPLIFIFNAKCACSNIKNIINDIDKLYETKEFFDVHKHFLCFRFLKTIFSKKYLKQVKILPEYHLKNESQAQLEPIALF